MSSFRKRNVQKPILGTRTSPHTGQVITSSGNPSLDLIFGGGLPIGSICLIEEDKFVTHSKVLAKYFLAEGVVSHHSLFLGSIDDNPAELLRKLPRPLDRDEIEREQANEPPQEDAAKNGLRIAWRYNDLPIVNSEQTSAKIGHYFNLMEYMDPIQLEYADTTVWNDSKNSEPNNAAEPEQINPWESEEESYTVANYSNETQTTEEATDAEADTVDEGADRSETPAPQAPVIPVNIFDNEKYSSILNKVHALLRNGKFNINALGKKSLCRVCITSLGSPLWYDEHFAKDILKFLTVLRAAVRGSVAVCFITMPMHLVAKCDETLVARIRNLVDYAIELESFAGSARETNTAFKEYHGLLRLRKMAAINTLTAHMPETSDLAFKLRRKKFIIEKLHLPPELQEQRSETALTKPALSCSSSGAIANPKTSLDF